MKSLHILLLLFAALLLCQCVTTTKVTYNIPDSYPQARREQLIGLFYKGEQLYKANCAACHGIFAKGKDSIPNFTAIQIDNYGAKFMNGDPLNHAVARKMSQEQLNEVLTFLRLKKVTSATGAAH